MAVLNKLLELLEELKEKNPELANRATLAAETLKAEGYEELEEYEEPEAAPPPPVPPEPAPVTEVCSGVDDDDYKIISTEDTLRLYTGRQKLQTMLTSFGSYCRDHEVKKLGFLERIEKLRANDDSLLESLKKKHNLLPGHKYNLIRDDSKPENLVFVKVLGTEDTN